jgi:hypothetical protein
VGVGPFQAQLPCVLPVKARQSAWGCPSDWMRRVRQKGMIRHVNTRTLFVALAVAIAVVASGCSSSSKHGAKLSGTQASSTSSSSTSSTSASNSGFQAGADPCRLITSPAILTILKQRMAQVSRSKSSCSYMNGRRTENVSISTAKTTRAGAAAAVDGTAGTVKGKVLHLGGIGDSAIAYLTTTKTLSIATCLFAKHGSLVFLYVGSPSATHLMPSAIALAKVAASHTP